MKLTDRMLLALVLGAYGLMESLVCFCANWSAERKRKEARDGRKAQVDPH